MAKHRAIPVAMRLPCHQPPFFLMPALARPTPARQHLSPFSTTATRLKKTGDGNRKRGVSALRRTGPRYPLSVSNEPLPRPVLDPAKRTKVKADPDHGLWQFFDKKKSALMTPEAVAAHGRSWTVEELRSKSWEDLHALWWVCAKERNRISTQEFERRRVKAGYGEHEANERDDTVRRTQKAIKHVLLERWYAYQNTLTEIKKDPTVLQDQTWEEISDEEMNTTGAQNEQDGISNEANGPAVVYEEGDTGSQPKRDNVRA